jgi:hypothetical protein
VRGSLFTGGGPIDVYGDSAPLIVDNDLRDGPSIVLYRPGADTTVRGRTVVDSGSVAIAIGSGRPLIASNVLERSRESGVSVGWGGAEASPILRDNVIIGAPLGIDVGQHATPTLEGNRIDVEGTAIHLEGSGDVVLTGNTICGGEAILAARDPETVLPSLDGNEVCELVAAR